MKIKCFGYTISIERTEEPLTELEYIQVLIDDYDLDPGQSISKLLDCLDDTEDSIDEEKPNK